MNKSYISVWNDVTGTWVAAPETAKRVVVRQLRLLPPRLMPMSRIARQPR
ncbi:ESPR domain-containing protein [Paraburkholderia kirstenboschensis]